MMAATNNLGRLDEARFATGHATGNARTNAARHRKMGGADKAEIEK
jgi:hypothetical protein